MVLSLGTLGECRCLVTKSILKSQVERWSVCAECRETECLTERKVSEREREKMLEVPKLYVQMSK